MLKVLSLGWGIQSFTIAAMMALKEIEPADVIIHADTTHESKLTYEFREKWEPFLIKSGLNVVTVINNTASKTDIINKYGGIIIPAYSVFQDRVGMIKRQCTDNWKRNPIKRYIQSIRNKQQVRMMIGISIDEWTRAKDAKEQYIVNEWPLIQNKISRNQCIEWLVDNNFEVPTKSACTFCPFKADSEWISTKKTDEDWDNALLCDKLIRNADEKAELYLHKKCRPLEEVIFSNEEKGQLELFNVSCDSGYCFL